MASHWLSSAGSSLAGAVAGPGENLLSSCPGGEGSFFLLENAKPTSSSWICKGLHLVVPHDLLTPFYFLILIIIFESFY